MGFDDEVLRPGGALCIAVLRLPGTSPADSSGLFRATRPGATSIGSRTADAVNVSFTAASFGSILAEHNMM